MEGEDSAQVLVRYDNGVLGHVTTSWAYQPAPGTEKFSIVAEKGSITSDGVTMTHRLRGADPVVTEFEPVHLFGAEIAHFADSIRTGSRPLHNYIDGIDVLGVILAAYASAETSTIAPVVRP